MFRLVSYLKLKYNKCPRIYEEIITTLMGNKFLFIFEHKRKGIVAFDVRQLRGLKIKFNSLWALTIQEFWKKAVLNYKEILLR